MSIMNHEAMKGAKEPAKEGLFFLIALS